MHSQQDVKLLYQTHSAYSQLRWGSIRNVLQRENMRVDLLLITQWGVQEQFNDQHSKSEIIITLRSLLGKMNKSPECTDKATRILLGTSLGLAKWLQREALVPFKLDKRIKDLLREEETLKREGLKRNTSTTMNSISSISKCLKRREKLLLEIVAMWQGGKVIRLAARGINKNHSNLSITNRSKWSLKKMDRLLLLKN